MNHTGCHKPGKQGKRGKVSEIKKLSESQGKLIETLIFEEKPGKLKGSVKYVT